MKKGIISAGHKETARAGAEVLRAGGNAYDAAIAAMMASWVTESASISAGGGGFLLAHTAQQKSALFDFFVHTPMQKYKGKRDFYEVALGFDDTNVQRFHVGMASMAVPGNIAGAFHIHQRLGKMPFAQLAQPAIALAKQGTTIDRFQALVIPILQNILCTSSTGKNIFAPKEQLKKFGENIYIPHLADTLEYLSKNGPREFYEGEIAQRLVYDCKDKGGFIRQQDMLNYRVRERLLHTLTYRNCTLLTNPPPSAGGTLIAFALQLLQSYKVGKLDWGSPKHVALLHYVMAFTNQARQRKYDANLHHPRLWEHFLAVANTSSYALALEQKMYSRLGNTSHISVIDATGNVASLTLSSGTGSGYFIPETGIMMNNMLGEADLNPKGFHQWLTNKRISSMMSPTIVLKTDGTKTALGSSGSNRIRTAILQVISNLLDFDMPLDKAVEQARIHTEGQTLNIEKGYAPTLPQRLNLPTAWNISPWQARSFFFGGVNAVAVNAKNQASGAADSRRFGCVMEV